MKQCKKRNERHNAFQGRQMDFKASFFTARPTQTKTQYEN